MVEVIVEVVAAVGVDVVVTAGAVMITVVGTTWKERAVHESCQRMVSKRSLTRSATHRGRQSIRRHDGGSDHTRNSRGGSDGLTRCLGNGGRSLGGRDCLRLCDDGGAEDILLVPGAFLQRDRVVASDRDE